MPIVIYDYSSIFNKKNKLFEYGKFHLFLPFKNFVEHIQWSLPCAEGGGGGGSVFWYLHVASYALKT